jgi:hypothetical protein
MRYIGNVLKFISRINRINRFYLTDKSVQTLLTDFGVELDIKRGSALLHCQRVDEAKLYVWQYSIIEMPTVETEWIDAQKTTQASVLLSNLTPLAQYWFRVVVLTTTGHKVFSIPVMQVIN